MAVDALLTCFGELAVGGKVYKWGTPSQPTRHSVTGDNVRDSVVAVANAATALLWTALVDIPSSFNLLVLESDQDVVVEFVTDDGNDVGEEAYTVTLKAGWPLTLGADGSYANYTVNFGGGTLDVIETIRCENNSGSDANVHILLSD